MHRYGDGIEFGIIAMGRYGGAELGFGSDADVMYVYRPAGIEPEEAQRRAEHIVHELVRLTEDLRLPLDLDAGLRPEGKNGAIVRSLESYEAYYERWSLTWEAQALLRARGVVGDAGAAGGVRDAGGRHPVSGDDRRRRGARDQADQGAGRVRAAAAGRRSGAAPEARARIALATSSGSCSCCSCSTRPRDPSLQTTSTLRALDAAVAAGLVPAADAERLRAAWLIASRARSAMTLWTAKTADVLPADRRQLEGVAPHPGVPGRAALHGSRRTTSARPASPGQVFERKFYGTGGS